MWSTAASHLLVLGSAECLWRDLERVKSLGLGSSQILAVNHAGVAFGGRIDHWASLHPDRFQDWRAERARMEDCITYAPWLPAGGRVDTCLTERWFGGSGLYAVQIALETLDAPRIVLAGIPLDGGPYFFKTNQRFGSGAALDRYRAAWTAAAYFFEDRVRSLSGWSRQLLGAPSGDWLQNGSPRSWKRGSLKKSPRSANCP